MSGNLRAVVPASSRMTEKARADLKEAIASAGGNEIFAICHLDGKGLVTQVEVAARGTSTAVPALESFFEKGAVLVHNHPSGLLLPSEADVTIAAQAGSFGVGSFIMDNDATEICVVAEPARPRRHRRLDEDEVAGVLDTGGRLARAMPNFEPRDSQVALARDVCSLFNNGGILAAEAGTGVGKSFAYLVPAMAWALGNDEKVVISTATINLQKQLIDKDIPRVSSIFKKPVKAVLIKGRGNYICKRRLAEALEEDALFLDDSSPLKKIAAWDSQGGSGDKSDLPFWPDESLWGRISSESDYCLSLHCPFRERCHVLRVRKEAADARIIVANHHILFADISARQRGSGLEQTSVLPAYDALVLDEAHSIESSATSLFSESFSRFSVGRRTGRLLRAGKRKKHGLGAKLASLAGGDKAMLKKLETALQEAAAAMSEMEAKALPLFGEGTTLRLKERTEAVVVSVCEPAAKLERAIMAASGILSDYCEALPESSEKDPAVLETKLVVRSFGELAHLVARFREFDKNGDSVFWMQKSKTSRKEVFVEFNCTPLDISSVLRNSVFSKIHTLLCTSATLAVGGSFAYWMKRVGIDKSREDVEAKIYPSPFPFSTNALLAIDSSAPHPQISKADFREYASEASLRLAVASGGRALVLCTSYDMLGACYEKARPVLDSMGITCLKQGMDEKSRLLDLFRTDISSVLFATDSFWEGIDAPGETLSLVIVTKLPFKVPDDPVQIARSEAVEKQGLNPFMEISLPEAVIKFKQGFGRLIRHSSDRGVVAVLDSRLATARYGQLFIESLPGCRRYTGNLDGIEKEVSRFLDE